MSDNRAGFLKTMLQAAEKQSGKERVYLAKDHEKHEWGIPIPWLSLQYLLQSSTLLLQKILMVAGQPQSCKSAFMYEMFRWFIEYGAVGMLLETESKTSPTLMRAVLGDQNFEYLILIRTAVIDDLQDNITNMFKTIQKSDDPYQVVMIGVDSYNGAIGSEQDASITKSGHADRRYPEAALKFTDFFKYMSNKIVGRPVLMSMTNHAKEDINSTAFVKSVRVPGGKAQEFHASYYLQLKRIKTIASKIDRSESRVISIETQKNSYAPNSKKIYVPFHWWFDETGRQHALWDWDTATADLLAGDFPGSHIGKPVKDICNVYKQGTSYTCSVLGLKGVSAREVGQAVRENTEIMSALQGVFHIYPYPVYDHLTALDAASHARLVRSDYSNIEDSQLNREDDSDMIIDVDSSE